MEADEREGGGSEDIPQCDNAGNVAYSVQGIRGKEGKEVTTQTEMWIVEQKERWEDGKLIIYAPTVSQVKAYAEALQCEAYYSQAEEKDRKLRELKSGEARLIVAKHD